MIDDTLNQVVSAAIYPPIGVMRVGNSPNDFFIGPEIDSPQIDPSGYRDKTGAIKRQAARFRIYGYDKDGQVVCELTQAFAEITWTARLANQKASWYRFELALDIPEAANAHPSTLRNPSEKNRQNLLIDGGLQSVQGIDCDGQTAQFIGEFKSALSNDTAQPDKDQAYLCESVYLGEMRTDHEGRLLMLGGHGVSKNLNGVRAHEFGNNDGWFDDISDGPVTAEVLLCGRTIPVKPAWVVCAPPDYAPMQKSVRTMWDLMRDVAVSANLLPPPKIPSFKDDILPIFQRMTDLQWVNAGFFAGFGWQSTFDFTSSDWMAKLADKTMLTKAQKRILFNRFRQLNTRFSDSKMTSGNQSWDPQPSSTAPQLWPWIYGDAMSVNSDDSPRQFLTLTTIQLNALAKWVEGDFIDDSKTLQSVTSLEEVPLHHQPEMLTKAAMDFCLADAFHPGCEMTWPMRTAGMYSEAFRLKHAANTAPTSGINYGDVMTPEIVSLRNGPLLSGQVAGGLTRWMAIPWQTDTASCRDGYNHAYDPYVPTFWPARVPNNILNQQHYDIVIDEKNPLSERKAAFDARQFWLDDLSTGPAGTYEAQINAMVTEFGNLAIVLPKELKGITHFPQTMQVGCLGKEPTQTGALLLNTDDEARAELYTELSSSLKARRFK